MDKRGLIDDIHRDMVTDYSKSSVQEELKEVLTKMPADFRDTVETRELRLEGIEKEGDGYFRDRKPVPDEILEHVMNRVDELMLTTSPLLYEYGLVYRGGVLLPDKAALMRGDE